jgi:hypothetical protein
MNPAKEAIKRTRQKFNTNVARIGKERQEFARVCLASDVNAEDEIDSVLAPACGASPHEGTTRSHRSIQKTEKTVRECLEKRERKIGMARLSQRKQKSTSTQKEVERQADVVFPVKAPGSPR